MRPSFQKGLRWLARRHSDVSVLGLRPLSATRRGELATTKSKFGPLYYRPGQSDLEVFRQVFSAGEYDITGLQQYKNIKNVISRILSEGKRPVALDLGANIGAASLWFSHLFPEAMIVAVEPDPANADLARRNTASTNNVKVIEAAIGSRPGFVAVEPHKDAWALRTSRAETGVRIVTVADAVASVADGRLFFAKIDIEGFEADLFAEQTEWLDDAYMIIIELHDWMMPGRGTSQSFQKALFGKGRELVVLGENLLCISPWLDS